MRRDWANPTIELITTHWKLQTALSRRRAATTATVSVDENVELDGRSGRQPFHQLHWTCSWTKKQIVAERYQFDFSSWRKRIIDNEYQLQNIGGAGILNSKE
jgi:hypothetical protein